MITYKMKNLCFHNIHNRINSKCILPIKDKTEIIYKSHLLGHLKIEKQ